MSTTRSGLRAWVRRRRTLLIALVQLVVLTLVVWFLLVPQLRGKMGSVHVSDLWHNPLLPVALAAELASLASYVFVTWSLLAPQSRPKVQRIGRIDLASIAAGKCVPDGGTAGTALCWRLLVKAGVPSTDAVVAKVAQGLGSAAVLQAAVLLILAAGSLIQGYSRWVTLPLLWSLGFLAVAGIGVLGGSIRGLRAWVQRLLGRIPRIGHLLEDFLDSLGRRDVVDHFRGLLSNPLRASVPVLFSLGNWAFDALALWISLRAYGVHINVFCLAIVYAIAQLAVWLPITPGGLGVGDTLMVPVLVGFGADPGAAFLGLVTWRFLSFVLPIPLGALSYGSLEIARTP